MMKGIIFDFDHKGRGITKLEEKIVFLDGGVIGDEIEYIVTKEKKNFYEGKIKKIIKKSKDRKTSPCPYSNRCGGCDFLEYDYDLSLHWKREKVRKDLKKLSQISDCEIEIAESPKKYHYRNNMQFQVKNGKVGLFEKSSKEIVDIKNCLMQSENANKTLEIIRKFKNLDKLKRIGIRTNYKDEVMLILVSKEKINKIEKILGELIDTNVVSIYENINKRDKFHYGEEFSLIYGREVLEEKINGLKYNLSPKSFFQVNRLQTEKMYNYALELLEPKEKEKIFDLYCGVGTISLEIARKGAEVVGVEIVEEAIEDARINAEKNNLKARFIKGASEDIIEKLEEDEKLLAKKILLDPPRKGLDQSLAEYLKEKNYEKIVYISCNPTTQARDINILKENYKLEKIKAYDLFPNTAHVETVVLMSRK